MSELTLALEPEKSKTKRAFKGVWIPASIWLNPDLTWVEKALLAEIDSLDDGTGCRATAIHLAKMIGSTQGSVRVMLSKLRKMGLLVDVESPKNGTGLRRIKVRSALMGVNGGCYQALTPALMGVNATPLMGVNTEVLVGDTNESTPSAPVNEKIPTAEPSPFREFTDRWCRCFEKATGDKYVFKARDGKAAAEIIKSGFDLDDFIATAKAAWQNNKDFYCSQAATLHGAWEAFNNIKFALAKASQVKPF